MVQKSLSVTVSYFGTDPPSSTTNIIILLFLMWYINKPELLFTENTIKACSDSHFVHKYSGF